ncbi:MAG: hypothetical protein ACK5NF_02425 [Bacilli bacterium]
MIDIKEKLNTSGILAGIVSLIIPFYGPIKTFMTFKTLKKNNAPSVLPLICAIAYIALPLFAFFVLILSFASVLAYISNSAYYYDFSYFDYFGAFFLIIPVCLISFYTIGIITGVKLKKFLDSEESTNISSKDRFDIAKVAGIYLYFIPFYVVIKVFTSLETLNQIDTSIKSLSLALIILIISSYLILFIPFLQVFVFFINLAIFIIQIILIVKLNGSINTITLEHGDNSEQFTSY